MAKIAMRKVCPDCGYINASESSNCESCGCDIGLCIIYPLDLNSVKLHKYYDIAGDKYIDAPIVKMDVAAPEEDVTENTGKADESTLAPKEEVKICPLCKRQNSADADECACGASLIRVMPVEKPEAKSDEEDAGACEKKPKVRYQLLIGKNGENVIDVDFSKGEFPIGAYSQSCLYHEMTVSRYHCFMRMREDGSIVLYEKVKRPSKNGTFIRITGERKGRLIPGTEYVIKNGTLFYLNDVPVLFRVL